jgi:4-hydroxy-3-methylbut-2-enyl diphosphate reductase
MQIELANPRGFCAGVDRAIAIVDRALELFGAPIYVRHEVVHNRYVVDGLRDRGAVFVDELDEVPDGATVVFSAHGVSQAVQQEAERRGLTVFDATCPLVTKVHLEVVRHARAGREVVLIGHASHPEVEGTMGRYDSRGGGAIYRVDSVAEVEALKVTNPAELAFVTQTTLSVDDARTIIDALKQRFPAIIGPKKDDICYATQNRQDAVRSLAEHCDVVLVVGSPNSSNSNRLQELALRLGKSAYLVDNAGELQPEWFEEVQRVGISAGASAPEVLVEEVIARLREWGVESEAESEGQREEMMFPLPKALQ